MHHNLIYFLGVTGICRVGMELKKSGVRSKGVDRSEIGDIEPVCQLNSSGRG